MPIYPSFILNKNEVNKIIEVSLVDLCSSEKISENEFISVGNKKITAPCFVFNHNKVWGATAMIVSEMIEILRNIEFPLF